MGYTGKQVIHPSQIEVVQETFLPTKAQMDWAHGLLESFKKHQSIGKVSIQLQYIICFSNYKLIGCIWLPRQYDRYAYYETSRTYNEIG